MSPLMCYIASFDICDLTLNNIIENLLSPLRRYEFKLRLWKIQDECYRTEPDVPVASWITKHPDTKQYKTLKTLTTFM